MKEIVKKLINNNKTISTMESCTGGYIAHKITNIDGASEVLKFSAVTYSNEYKIKMGVSEYIVDKYSVYSMETANEMSKKISEFTNSDYGLGITGKLNSDDINNVYGEDDIVYISIYDKNLNTFYEYTITVTEKSRENNKRIVLKKIEDELNKIIK